MGCTPARGRCAAVQVLLHQGMVLGVLGADGHDAVSAHLVDAARTWLVTTGVPHNVA